MRRVLAAAAAIVATACATVGVVVADAPAVASSAPDWADIRADVEVLAGAVDAQPATVRAPGLTGMAAHEPVAGGPGDVAALLGQLDGGDDTGAAASVWRSLFGSGAAALAPGSGGPPVAVARFADRDDVARFVARRLARARAAVQGREGPAPGAAALHGRLRRAATALSAPRSVEIRPGVPAPCGPVRVEASGDTAALAGLCADLRTYWGDGGGADGDGGQGRAAPSVVKVTARRTGPLPQAERDLTALASAVDRAGADVETFAARTTAVARVPERGVAVRDRVPAAAATAATAGSATGRRGAAAAPAPQAPRAPLPEPAQAPASAQEPAQEPAQAPASAQEPEPLPFDEGASTGEHGRGPDSGPEATSPPGLPVAAAAPEVSRPAAGSLGERVAPVLVAAKRPRNWMAAGGGVAALVCGVALVRRMRERRWAAVAP
ncbi:MAG: hypothetical protein U0U69_15080 [Acidimicrobiia bacterium]